MQQLLPLEPAVSGGRDFEVSVVRSARRRTLSVLVDGHGRVEARAPLRMAQSEILVFLDRHADWIRRKVDEARADLDWSPLWRPGGQWYWQGGLLELGVGSGRAARVDAGRLLLPVPAGAAADAWRRAVIAWHRRQAQELLGARIDALFGQHCAGHRLQGVRLRWMRATWATCGGRRAADGRRDVIIRVNPWLAALPGHLMDAVLLHELAHVEHMHHGAAFYRRLERLDPLWREHDRALRPWARRLFPVPTA